LTVPPVSYPGSLPEIIELFETLPEPERRENLVAFAESAANWRPEHSEHFDLKDIRKDEECTDEVGIFLRVEDGKAIFTVTLRDENGDASSPSVGDALLQLDLTCTEPSTCGDGVIDGGEECDDGNNEYGDCCSPGCKIEASGTVCRGSAGGCDLVETCDGLSPICPADLVSTDVCRPAAGECDLTEFCDGVAVDCPPDIYSTDVCRPAVDECDIEEACDGASLECPPDEMIEGCTICGDGVVEGDEQCDDGNTQSGDGCDAFCRLESIGVPAISTWGMTLLTVAMRLLFSWYVLRRRRDRQEIESKG